eukprot:TRINITY_DN62796_c0_g1_i1.p1 TRINITY_DN62796_c0_g1~~TRINITY_DN62796_c0_g1_i1.p1  ORF type:complete len:1335 (-),score=110.27 TRINITY_DN62796_c0_g1_i1:171-4124(-)
MACCRAALHVLVVCIAVARGDFVGGKMMNACQDPFWGPVREAIGRVLAWPLGDIGCTQDDLFAFLRSRDREGTAQMMEDEHLLANTNSQVQDQPENFHDCMAGVLSLRLVMLVLSADTRNYANTHLFRSNDSHFMPPWDLCLVVAQTRLTNFGTWPVGQLLTIYSDCVTPLSPVCFLSEKHLEEYPEAFAIRLLHSLTRSYANETPGGSSLDLCVGQALPVALLHFAGRYLTKEHVERFILTNIYEKTCVDRSAPFSQSLFSFIASPYKILGRLYQYEQMPLRNFERPKGGPGSFKDGLFSEQKRTLHFLMEAAHMLCQLLGLRYAVNGGGLLGSMRHMSLIPWDDDAEMCLLEDDDVATESLLFAVCLRLQSLQESKPDSVSQATLKSVEGPGYEAWDSLVNRAAEFLNSQGIAMHARAKNSRLFRLSLPKPEDEHLWGFPSFDLYITSKVNSTHRRAYSKHNGPYYPDTMSFPLRKRYWRTADESKGLVLWTFNRPAEYLQMLYGPRWKFDCVDPDDHGNESLSAVHSAVTLYDGASTEQVEHGVRVESVPCSSVSDVIESKELPEETWRQIDAVVSQQLGRCWIRDGSGVVEAAATTVLVTMRLRAGSSSCEVLVSFTSRSPIKMDSAVCSGLRGGTWVWEDQLDFSGENEDSLCARAGTYSTIILGGGPAGLGPLYHASMRGGLESLLERGVLILERSDRLGVGTLAYEVDSNSVGRAFLDHFDNPNVSKLFPRTLASSSARNINVSVPVPLSDVAEFHKHLGEELQEIIQRFPSSRVVLHAEVKELAYRTGDQTVTVSYKDVNTGRLYRAEGEHAVIAMGGAENLSACLYEPLGRTDLTLDKCGFRSLTPAHVALQGVAEVEETVPLVVIGGSHSAWSLLEELGNRQWSGNATVIERSHTRYFAYSADEAMRANISFDPLGDACPVTGRINRFTGLRGKVRDFAQARASASWLHTVMYQKDAGNLCDILPHAQVVCASGYSPRWPRIRVDGRLTAVVQPINTVEGNLITDAGILRNIFAYGLGAGLRTGSLVGGELSGWGEARADGVWIYNFDVGGLIYRRLMSGASIQSRGDRWQHIYNLKAARLNSELTPLHHFGGYEMFSWLQWSQQVQKLAEHFPDGLNRRWSMLEVGVGAGAFAAAVQAVWPQVQVTGIDAAPEVIRVARQRLKGQFFVAPAEDLSRLFSPKSFDSVVAFGVTTYLDSESVLEAMLMDMLKVARKFVYVGEVSDAAKRDAAEAMRALTHMNSTSKQAHVASSSPPHLYVGKDVFSRVADAAGARLRIMDHDALGLTYATATYRFSAYFDFSEVGVPS